MTGVSSGLGRMTAERLVGLGWDVLGTVRRPLPDPPCGTVELDVTDDDGVLRVGALVGERWGRLDALVNNAGIGVLGPVEEMAPDELRRNLDVNLVAPMALARACLPWLRAAGGAVVQVSSVSGFSADRLFAAYNASKWGLEGASEALRLEVAPHGVRVVLVEPGPFRTELAVKSPTVAARGASGLYDDGWRDVDEFLRWHHRDSPDAAACVDAIVAAATRADAPHRLPVGEGIAEHMRERARMWAEAADAAEEFLAGR